MPDPRAESFPDRALPILYFGFAYLAFATAMGVMLWNPRAVAGFFYHARIVGVVHLVTLGWISASIAGALYIVGPLALRMPLPARLADYVAYAAYVVGVIGMISHFWIEQLTGMAWSGAMVAAALVYLGARVVTRIFRAPVQPAVRWHVTLAFANILIASAAGVVLGFDKAWHFLPGFRLANVVAHAHLAAVGWACMMVIGVGYRLLPMLLPAAMPSGRTLGISAILLEAGTLGLFAAIVLRSALVGVWAVIVASGFAAFFVHVGWMLRNRRSAPPRLPRPDYGVRHAALAMGSLGITLVLGLVLAFQEPAEWTLRAALAYGVFGLVGFLAQMVVGMQVRLLPMFAWYCAAARTPVEAWGRLTSPHVMAPALAQHLGWILWAAGVPLLALGFALDRLALLTAGAAALELAILAGGWVALVVLSHAFRAIKSPYEPERRRAAARQLALPARHV